MIQTLTTHQTADILRRDGNAGWSWAGALALAEHLEQIEAETGEPMELDPVAVRCDFSEFASLEEWAAEHFGSVEDALQELGADPDDLEDRARRFLQRNTTLLEFSGGVIVRDF